MDNLQVSATILPENVDKELKQSQKMTKFFRVLNVDGERLYELNIPSIGSFRMNLVELVIFVLIINRILKIV